MKKFVMDNSLKPRHKRGDIREDGRMFWQYTEKGTKELWVTSESFTKRSNTLRNWVKNNRFKVREHNRKWRSKNPEKAEAATKRWRQKNPEKLRLYKAAKDAWWDKNRDYVNAIRRVRMKHKRSVDPMFALSCNLRTRLNNVLRLQKKVKPCGFGKILGTTLEHTKEHLESKFKPGMSWSNYGEWHVDHIIPLASAKSLDEIISLCHYTNLQPLWAKENMSKGARQLDA
jgi:hypothetical protein